MYSDSSLARLTPLFAVITLPLGILVATFVSLTAAAAVFVVGWLLLTPASAVLFGAPRPGSAWVDDEVQDLVEQRMAEKLDEQAGEAGSERSGETAPGDPVEELRARYARGEIDEIELERRLDALLEMEDVDPNDEESIERVIGNLDSSSEARTTVSDTEADVGAEAKEMESTDAGASELNLDRE